MGKGQLFFNWGCFPKDFEKTYLKEEIKYYRIQRKLVRMRTDIESVFRKDCEKTRTLTARLCNISGMEEHIIFNGSTLKLLSEVVDTYLTKGDEIIITDGEFPEVYEKLTARNFNLKIIKIFGLNSKNEIINKFLTSVTSNTSAVFFSDVLWSGGMKLPTLDIVKAVKKTNPQILTIIDGAQAFGHVNVDLSSREIDFYIADYHKWIRALSGAFVFINDNLHLRKFSERVEGAFALSPKLKMKKSGFDGLAFALAATHRALQPFFSKKVREVIRNNNTLLSTIFKKALHPLEPIHFKISPPDNFNTGIVSLFYAERSLYDYLTKKGVSCTYIPDFEFTSSYCNDIIQQPRCIRIMLNDKPGGNTKNETTILVSFIKDFYSKERGKIC